MLSVKGIYDGKVIIPLTEVNKKANTPVIITFLEDDEGKNINIEGVLNEGIFA